MKATRQITTSIIARAIRASSRVLKRRRPIRNQLRVNQTVFMTLNNVPFYYRRVIMTRWPRRNTFNDTPMRNIMIIKNIDCR
jgi:hypothetical protein